MERLTYDFCIGDKHCWQVKGADNALCKDVCKEQGGNGCDGCPIKKAFDRLAAYEDTIPLEWAKELVKAEKDGRIVLLPCKPGTDVYIGRRKALVEEFFGFRTERYLQAQFYDNFNYTDIPFEDIGKTVFLTREEAEAALKKREETDNEH